jgi:predicted  nucleic acid-binding Zn-ribbon protein
VVVRNSPSGALREQKKVETMARDLDSLVRLQELLTEANNTRELLAGVPDSMKELLEEHQAHSATIERLKEEIDQAELERRSAEATAEDAQARLVRYQQQVSQVTTQREYGSLLKEIDAAKEEVSANEELALASLENIEEARAQLETESAAFEEVDARYQEKLSEWEKEKPSVARRLEGLEAEEAQLREVLPRRLVVRFERLYERLGGEALAAIQRVEKSGRSAAMWHCSNCNYRVRPQVVFDIRNNGSLNQCESCQCFLFWNDDSA